MTITYPKVTHKTSHESGHGKNFYVPADEKTKAGFKRLFPRRKKAGAFLVKDIDILKEWGVEFDVVDKDGNIVRRITGC